MTETGWQYIPSENSKKNIFILGAGFSKPFGFPLASELFQYLFKKGLPKFLDHGPRKEDFCRLVSIFLPIVKESDFEKIGVQLANLEKKSEGCLFEILLTRLDAWLQLSKIIGDNGEEDLVVKDFKKFLLRWVTYCFDQEVINCKKNTHWKDLLSFVDIYDKDSWFITLNYDNILERAFFINGYKEYKEYPISKIHGSIDWWKVGKHITPSSPHIFETLDDQDEHYSVLRVKTIEEIEQFSDMGYGDVFDHPVIVPLTHFKDYNHSLIKDELLEATKKLKDAENVFIIGSSFATSEFVLRELMRFSSYRRKLGVNQIKWHIIDPKCMRIVESFENELGIECIVSFEGSWIDWIQKKYFF